MEGLLKSFLLIAVCAGFFVLTSCQVKSSESDTSTDNFTASIKPDFNGFESEAAWGEHLVIIGGCHDCHTPKKFTAHGVVLDSSRFLSGHPSDMPLIDIDRNEIESKGLSVAGDLTEWVGPWGVSFTANLTPDPTGIGNWELDQFIYCLRNGITKGVPGSRPILPPMPWEMIGQMTDAELKAVFIYLQTVEPVKNLVPAPLPPVSLNN